MTLHELIEIADQGYSTLQIDEGGVLAHFDPVKGQATREAHGDTLAHFVVIELCETFDPDATENEQFQEAQRVIERAADDLNADAAAFTEAQIRRLHLVRRPEEE